MALMLCARRQGKKILPSSFPDGVGEGRVLEVWQVVSELFKREYNCAQLKHLLRMLSTEVFALAHGGILPACAAHAHAPTSFGGRGTAYAAHAHPPTSFCGRGTACAAHAHAPASFCGRGTACAAHAHAPTSFCGRGAYAHTCTRRSRL